MSANEEPEPIDPDHVQQIVWHRWRADWIEGEIRNLAVLERSFERMRSNSEAVGGAATLNLRIEDIRRHEAMLYGWLMEERELERRAGIDYLQETNMREVNDER